MVLRRLVRGPSSWGGGSGGGGTDDQTAAEVPFTAAGDLSSTDVQAALEELDGEKVAGDAAVLDTVSTTESTTSTSYTDLTTTGPQVTFDVPASGKVLVVVSAMLWTDTEGAVANVDFALSGANTRSAQDSTRLRVVSHGVSTTNQLGVTTLLTGLTAGSTTATAKYKVAGGSAEMSAANRRLSVIPL